MGVCDSTNDKNSQNDQPNKQKFIIEKAPNQKPLKQISQIDSEITNINYEIYNYEYEDKRSSIMENCSTKSISEIENYKKPKLAEYIPNNSIVNSIEKSVASSTMSEQEIISKGKINTNCDTLDEEYADKEFRKLVIKNGGNVYKKRKDRRNSKEFLQNINLAHSVKINDKNKSKKYHSILQKVNISNSVENDIDQVLSNLKKNKNSSHKKEKKIEREKTQYNLKKDNYMYIDKEKNNKKKEKKKEKIENLEKIENMKTHFTPTKANFRRNNTHNNIINNNNEINNIMINTMKPAYGRNEKRIGQLNNINYCKQLKNINNNYPTMIYPYADQSRNLNVNYKNQMYITQC